MIYGYIRVSSDKQTVENQRFELTNYAKANNFTIDDWVDETISGTKSYKVRKLGNLLSKRLKKGDVLLCAEISRLGRKLFMIMEILNMCMEAGIQVWTVKEGYRLGDDIQSKVLAFAFSLSAEIERNLISQRTKEALARKKAEGVILGRPKGRQNSHVTLTGKEAKIQKLLDDGLCISKIAKKLKVNRETLAKFMWNNHIYTKKNMQVFACIKDGWTNEALLNRYGFGKNGLGFNEKTVAKYRQRYTEELIEEECASGDN